MWLTLRVAGQLRTSMRYSPSSLAMVPRKVPASRSVAAGRGCPVAASRTAPRTHHG